MLTKVWATISEHKLILPGELVVVGVSGGPDSLTLLHVLHLLSKEGKFKLHAAHLNHSFRGQEADEEASWVKEVAESWGIACTVVKEDIPALIKRAGLSPEAAGHLVRQKFFLALLQELQGQKIALGQQADDQAETILMHLLSGAGGEGLQGIRPANFPYVRPLLFITRKEIEEYCQSNGLEPRRDASNQENVYLRNRIRNQLLPWLKENINPNLVTNLQKTAVILQSEEDYWREIMTAYTKQHLRKIGEEVSLELTGLCIETVAVQRRIIRFVCQQITGEQGLSYLHVEEIRKLAVLGQVGKRIILPGGLTVCKEYQQLLLTPNYQDELAEGIKPRLLTVPGETLVPETGTVIKASLSQEQPGTGQDRAWIPIVAGQLPQLCCRSRQLGDWLKPRGMTGRKKLKEFFIDQKIPRKERDRVMLIAEGSEVLWIPGWAISSRMNSLTPENEYLVLELRPDRI